MKIVKIKGGLGNQLFQYAFAKYLEKISKDTIKLDFSYFKDMDNDSIRKPRILKFRTSLDIATQQEINNYCLIKHGCYNSLFYKYKILLELLFNNKYFCENNGKYKALPPMINYNFFDGYWQDYKIVDNIYENIKNDLNPNYELNSKTIEFISKVKSENSVSVGIRRGDYIKNGWIIYNIDYYIKAMEYIETIVSNPIYYIFSNDIDWVKKNLNFGKRKIIYREQDQIIDDFEDFMIMANCKHSIIINSTYHWWGARMNYSKNKIVVAPQKWFKNNIKRDSIIIPNYWHKI